MTLTAPVPPHTPALASGSAPGPASAPAPGSATEPASSAASPSGEPLLDDEPFLKRLGDLIASRRGADPGSSYVARLLSAGEDVILKKVGEEATETVMAGKDGDPARIVAETADLWFHCMVMLAHYGLRAEDVIAELKRREGLSGLDEKALRKQHGQRTSDE